MDNLIYILIGTVAVLVLCVFWMQIRFNRIQKQFHAFWADVKQLHHEAELIRGRLTQAETIELDLSVLENQIEENSQQVLSYVRGEVGNIVRKIKNMDEQFEELERQIEELDSTLNEDSQKLEEIEEKMEEKVEEE